MKTVVFIRQTAIYYDSRALKTIQTLSQQYKVLVLGWDRDGKGKSKLQEKSFQNVEFFLFDKKLPHGSGKKGLFLMIQFFRWTKKKLAEFRNVDFVHCCDLDGTIGVFHYLNKHHIPLIYDIYDYYTEAHTGIPNLLKNLIQAYENKIIEKAEVTIICTEQRKQQIKNAKPKKVIVVHNTPEMDENLSRIKESHSKYKLCFIGALADHRLLCEIAETIDNYPEFEITFGGNGELLEHLTELASKNEQIKYIGTLDYSKVLEYEASCDLLFATYSPAIPNHRYCAPNKIYEAMALQKPIIVCKGTGIDELITQEEIGEVINYSADDFFIAARKLLYDKERLVKIEDKCRRIYVEKYSWKIMSERLLKMYDEI